MYQVRDIYTNMTIKFNTIYQISKWLYDSRISKSMKTDTYIRKNLLKQRVVYRHYLITEMEDTTTKN